MKNITITVPIAGKPCTLEFSHFRFDNYVMYDLQGQPPCELLPERMRITRVLDKSPQLSKIHETIRIDPQVQTYEAKALFFRIVSELFIALSEAGPPSGYEVIWTSHIQSAQDYQ